MAFLMIDKVNGGDVAIIPSEKDDLREVSDTHLEQALEGQVEIIRVNAETKEFERLEFVNGLVPNWVDIPEV